MPQDSADSAAYRLVIIDHAHLSARMAGSFSFVMDRDYLAHRVGH
jgi:hypothetical protein